MAEYICNKCNTKFKYKSYYIRHQNRKNDCSKDIINTIETLNLLNEAKIEKPVKQIMKPDNTQFQYQNIQNKTDKIEEIKMKPIKKPAMKPKMKPTMEPTNNKQQKQINTNFNNNQKTIDNNDDNKNDYSYKMLKELINNIKIPNHKLKKIFDFLHKLTDNDNSKTNEPNEPNNIKHHTFNDLINLNNNTNNTNNNNKIQNILLNNKPKNNKQHICHICNNRFAHRESLFKHIKFNRCSKTIAQQPIIQVNTNNNNNYVKNVKNVQNIYNNNITININPFRCESLDHISLEDFKYIYKTCNNIDYKLCFLTYNKNKNNIYFYKNNIKQDIVTFINDKMELESMTEDNFIKELKYNINDSKIELFYIFKNELSVDEIVKYMKNMIAYHYDFPNNPISQKKFDDALRLLLDSAYRDKNKKNEINNIITNLSSNHELHMQLCNKYKDIIKIKEQHSNEHKNITNSNNNDDKNLYKLYTNTKNEIDSCDR